MAEREGVDRTKFLSLEIEIAKQVSTLGAGAIVILGTFLTDIFPSKHGTLAVGWLVKLLIAASFVGFGASVLLAAMAMFLYHLDLQRSQPSRFYQPRTGTQIGAKSSYVARQAQFFCLALGLIFFGSAVILNLYR